MHAEVGQPGRQVLLELAAFAAPLAAVIVWALFCAAFSSRSFSGSS
jgi:hypothetical protein